GTIVAPWYFELYASIVDKEPRLEIIGPVQDDVRSTDDVFDILEGQIGHDGRDVYAGIDPAQAGGRCYSFWKPLERVALFEYDLPLKIRFIDEIAINQDNSSAPSSRQGFGLNRPQRSAAHDDGFSPGDARLTDLSDSVEEDLPGISIESFHTRWS